jgi:cysteinyl-tRNA synthetase
MSFFLRIFDTLTGQKKELSRDGEFRMFVCGPTVQDYVHLGHAKTYLAFDLLARWLLRSGYKVFFLINITDVDDKIFDRARKESSSYISVADKFYKEFLRDLEDLNIVTVSKFARVSKYVENSAVLVQRLLDLKKAYALDGDVYFDTSKAVEFGKLSHQSTLDLKFKQIDAAPGKRNSVDFLLWRNVENAKEGVWETTFGRGRPGWHIEDSAIAFAELGGPYDLHGGATELIFPHHEAELAQDEAISGSIPFVGIWMHTGLLLKGKEKMSKSLGNVITIKEGLKDFTADELRFYFAKHHYRESFEVDLAALGHAKEEFKLLSEVAISIPKKETSNPQKLALKGRDIWEEFSGYLDDDLDTPNAHRLIVETARRIKEKSEVELCPVFWDMAETLGFELV